MGDLTWLSTLGPSGLLALGVGLIFLGALVPRWVLTRERQISDQWRRAYETLAASTTQQTDLLRQFVVALEGGPQGGTGRHRRGG